MKNERVEKLRERMENESVEVTLINSPENRFYFSGFKGSSGWVIITKDQKILYTDFRYGDQALKETDDYEVKVVKPPLLSQVLQFVKKGNYKSVGLEYNQLPVHDFLQVKKELPGIADKDMENEILKLRMIKDEEEISYFKKGIEICDQAFSHILSFIQPGMTEREIGLELEFFMKRAGAEGIKENHVIASGPRSALPHGQATERVINNGEFLKMDIGAKINGYYTDFTRTVAIGEPTTKQTEIYQIVKDAQEQSLAAIEAGRVCSQLDEVGRSVIRKAGYGEHFGHSLGHSIGLHVHESPVLRSTDKTILQAGMAMTVEPGIYIPEFGGVRIEDFVIVQEGGIKNLTTSTKELQVI